MTLDYTAIAKTYDTYRSYSPRVIQQMIACGEMCQDMKVLDLGCGTGNVSRHVQECLPVEMIGVDISPAMLRQAKAKSLQVICADITHLPFQAQVFDTIIGAYVIHQIRDGRGVMRECSRILREDGIAVLLTSSHHQIEQQHPVLSRFFPSCIAIEHARFPDISQLASWFNAAGFTHVTHQEVLIEQLLIDQEFLRRVKQKYVSTYHLLPQDEFQRGVEHLETFITQRDQPELSEWRGTLIYGRKRG